MHARIRATSASLTPPRVVVSREKHRDNNQPVRGSTGSQDRPIAMSSIRRRFDVISQEDDRSCSFTIIRIVHFRRLIRDFPKPDGISEYLSILLVILGEVCKTHERKLSATGWPNPSLRDAQYYYRTATDPPIVPRGKHTLAVSIKLSTVSFAPLGIYFKYLANRATPVHAKRTWVRQQLVEHRVDSRNRCSTGRR